MDNGTNDAHRDPHSAPSAAGETPPGLSLSALQRRRLLLRGAGRGAAVIAAAVPMQTFAASILKAEANDGKAYVCSVSGMGSNLASAMPRGMGTCSGKSAAYWADPNTTWPAARVSISSSVGVGEKRSASGSILSRDTQFKAVFGGTSQHSFGRLLSSSQTEQQVWVRALLNAHDGYPTTFPYSPTEVVQMYQNPGQRAAATTFFRDWV